MASWVLMVTVCGCDADRGDSEAGGENAPHTATVDGGPAPEVPVVPPVTEESPGDEELPPPLDCDGTGDFAGIAKSALVALADTNRDGEVDGDDLAGRNQWTWSRGAFLSPNLDDDDSDGKPDAEDEVPNGSADADDLAPVRVELGCLAALRSRSVTIHVIEGASATRVFLNGPSGFVAMSGPLPSASSILLGMEANRLIGADFNGFVRLRVEANDETGELVAADEVKLRIAPWIMLPSTAPAIDVHVASGVYDNGTFRTDLNAATSDAAVTLAPPFLASHWQEMWAQDTMEIGYTQLPGRSPQYVVLQANRDHDGHAPSLLGADMGVIRVGTKRDLVGGDAWADWFGNLEVSPPVEGWPLGRIYYGHNTSTGTTLHPDVVAFLNAQEVQAPFWVDTSWLLIKHVDELLTFVRTAAGETKLVVVSPREAGLLYPSYYGPYNQGLQSKIDKALDGGSYLVNGVVTESPGILAALRLDRTDVVELPIFFTDGTADWSNPVNALVLDDTYVLGETDIWQAERDVTEERLTALGLAVRWVDDAAYHANLGNVHCATNATRSPVLDQFVEGIPPALQP
ncbi:MAG: protein-arginine deiminase family protein [Myxococcota bacterium]